MKPIPRPEYGRPNNSYTKIVFETTEETGSEPFVAVQRQYSSPCHLKKIMKVSRVMEALEDDNVTKPDNFWDEDWKIQFKYLPTTVDTGSN